METFFGGGRVSVKNRILWSHIESFLLFPVCLLLTHLYLFCAGVLTSNSSLKTNTWPSVYLEHSSFLTLSYLPNWGLLIIQGLLNGGEIFLLSCPISSQFSTSLVKLMLNCSIYLLSLLVQPPLESWRCSPWILCIILCIILCFFVTGFFCDLTEYQAAILHLKREHKEEIENLQVYLFNLLNWLC